MNIFKRFQDRFPEPDALFARLEDGRWYTYGDVEAVSARFANHLVSLGVEPGDRVAVQVPKSIEALMLYLGTVRAGAVFLPLNTAYTPAEVDYFVGDAEPRVLVCDPLSRDALAPIATKAGARLETMGVWAADGGDHGTLVADALEASLEFETVERADDDLAAILYTSGTTGRSKGAMLSHANLWSNAEALVKAWRFTGDDLLIHALPIFHTHGLFVATHCVLASGAALHLLPGFDAERILDLMAEGSDHREHGDRQASALMGVPTFYTRLLRHERLGEAARGMRLFTSGSAPLLAETHRSFERATGQRILERYGMTETNMNTSNPYEGERRAGTVGMPLPGVGLRIMENGREVAAEEVGTIEVRGPNVFRGYWRMPDKTAEEFTDDGWFVTGDLGTRSPDGYVAIVGRGKDLVISGGFNVYPKEVEDAIDALPGVDESAVIGLPHADFGEAVTAVVVPCGEAPDEDAIIAALKDRLARYKQPKRVLFRDHLPRNTMGKVQKNALRDEYAGLYAE